MTAIEGEFVVTRMRIRSLARMAMVVAFAVLLLPTAAHGQSSQDLPPGTYLLEFEIFLDECGHDPFIEDLPEAVVIEVADDGSLTITGNEPWVDVVAEIDEDGSVLGGGIGLVAGFEAVSIALEGQIIEPGVIEGLLFYGAGGELPGDCPIIWTLTLISETPVTPPTTTTEATTTTTTVAETTTTETETTTTTVAETTTTVSETTTSVTKPANGEDDGGEFPWVLLIAGGGVLILIGIWVLAKKGDCEEELAAWLRAKKACDDATAAEARAEQARDDAETERDNAQDDLDELCDSFPPACWDGDPTDTWAEDPDRAGSRIDRLDVYAGRAYSRHLWGEYRDGNMSADQLQDAWNDPVPEEFKDDIRDKYDEKKAEHDRLEGDVEDTQEKLDDAQGALDDARQARRDACGQAEEARRRLEECLGRASAAGGEDTGGGGGTGPEGPSGPGGPTDPGDESDEPGCTDGEEREVGSRTLSVSVPVDFEPIILGGEAHRSAEEARGIAADLKQVEIAADALGKLFGLAPGVKLVREFTWGGAIGLGVSVGGELTNIPIPTNPAEAAANYLEILVKAAGTIIAAVPGWQERRLPDVELRIQMKSAPFLLTCTDIEECRDGVWVRSKRRFSMERSGPDRSGGRKDYGGGHTWDQAQELIQIQSRRFAARQHRELEKMRRFQQECEAG